MNKPTVIALWVVGLVAVAGLATGGWLWERSQQQPEAVVSSDSGSVPIKQDNAGTPAPAIPLDAPPTSQKSQGAVAGTTNLSVPSNTGSSSKSAGLPGPADFGQYNQYKTAANAMYVDVVPGTGSAVAAGSKIKVNYSGWLTNGQMFDQSKQPFALTEGAHAVISGWEEGLFGMKAGGKRRLIIPPAFGYGAQGQGPIPGDAVLVFDVELLEVQ